MSKYSINNELNAIYSQLRFEAEQDLDSRLQDALKIQDFKSLYTKRKAVGLELTKKQSNELKEEYKKLSQQLLAVIEKNNIDLNIYHKCPKCKDTGYINGIPCECRLKLSKRLLRAESKLPKFATNTFEDSKFSTLNVKQAKKMEGIYKDCKRWAENIDNASKRIIYLMGGVGTGKTTLSFCIANKLIENGHSVYFATAFDLSNLIIEKQFNRLQNIDDYYNMLDADLLIIDDLGTEPQNTLMQEGLFAILDSRINNNKKTVICTNLTEAQFAKRYGERSLSRLTSASFAYKPSYIDGDDLRKIKC
ncbi:MAG: hypothetical protein E7338_07080 [Clostridiales bacterium]|nr:hypothetical protein [Clostridiales bacterium]